MAASSSLPVSSPSSVTDCLAATLTSIASGLTEREPLTERLDFCPSDSCDHNLDDEQESAPCSRRNSFEDLGARTAAVPPMPVIDAAVSASALALLSMTGASLVNCSQRSSPSEERSQMSGDEPGRTSGDESVDPFDGADDDDADENVSVYDDLRHARNSLLPAVRKRNPRMASNLKRRINEEARIRHFGWKMVRVEPLYEGAAASHCWMHPVHGRASSKKQIFRFHRDEPPVKKLYGVRNQLGRRFGGR